MSLPKKESQMRNVSTSESEDLGSFGIKGLYGFLQSLQKDPSIGTLALGLDLTNLGLDLNSSK